MNRRRLLQVAGATSVLPLAGGMATADNDEDEKETDNGGQSQRECPRPECIHPTLGYTGLASGAQLPDPLEPDHEVDLITRPPEEEEGSLPEFFFEPTGLSVDKGDVIRFNLATPDHTVTAYHPGLGRQRRVPEDIPPFSSPVLAGGTFWLYRFPDRGVYDVLCAPHEIFGMVGRIVAGDASLDLGDPGPGNRPPSLTAALVYDDPALEPDNIKDEGQVQWADLDDESKRILIELPDENGE